MTEPALVYDTDTFAPNGCLAPPTAEPDTPPLVYTYDPCCVCGKHYPYYARLSTDLGDRLICGECITAAVKILVDLNTANTLQPEWF